MSAYVTDLVNSGIFVVENLTRGLPIPRSRKLVTAFVGPAPRGPVNLAVTINNIEEFLANFGSPEHSSRMEQQLHQYFDNGGEEAVIVRIVSSDHRKRIELPGMAGPLILEARNPGPYEYLRVSVDYDNIPNDDECLFNLTVHRLRSSAEPFVDEQEIFRAVSTDPSQQNYIGNLMENAGLVVFADECPAHRPFVTSGLAVGEEVSYVYCSNELEQLAPPGDYDLIGSENDTTGIFALNQVPVIDYLAILPGDPLGDLGPVILFAAERYCKSRNAMLIVDPLLSWVDIESVISDSRLEVLRSPNLLVYFPRLRTFSSTGSREPASAAGAIAGLLARNDTGAARFGTRGDTDMMIRRRNRASYTLEDYEVEQLERLGINSLYMAGPGRVELRGLVTSARSTAQVVEWNSLKKRRAALYVIDCISHATRWAAFQDNAAEVWKDLNSQIEEFLGGLYQSGVFAGSTAGNSFYIKCDIDTNSRLDGQNRRLSFVVGIALTRPGVYLAFRFQHDHLGCVVSELGWQPGFALSA